jgi:hypothetical protein
LRGLGKLLKRCRGLPIEISEYHLRQISRVSNGDFLAFVEQHFDEACFLPEKSLKGQAASKQHPKAACPEMMGECCRPGIPKVKSRALSFPGGLRPRNVSESSGRLTW